MVNNLVLWINLVGLLLIDTFSSGGIQISQNVPASMEPGSEVKVVVNIEKGDLTGFAKFQLDMPEGFTVTALETKGASFTFADQKAKFIWMALPSTPTFRISYTLRAELNASGPKRIEGRMSYIENNERKTLEIAPITVDLGSGSPSMTVSAVTEVEVAEDPAPGEEFVSMVGGAPAKGLMVAVIEQASGVAPIQGAGGVSGTRVITPVSEQEMLVEVTVNKGDIRGFGKLQETVPQGFTAVEKSSDEAIFTTQDRIVKFVWLNLPARATIKVTYKLRANQRPDGEYSIDGEFGYLLNDETQKAVLGTSRFFVGPKAMEMLAVDAASMDGIQATDVDLAVHERTNKTNPESRPKEPEQVKDAPRTSAPIASEPKRTERSESSRIPAPEKGVNFKVQITAAHREVGKDYFRSRHRYSGDFSIERHQGWIKYVTGNFGTYADAREQRIRLVQAGHEFPGPFVTAYNNGERITVQEALMLSGQKWMQ